MKEKDEKLKYSIVNLANMVVNFPKFTKTTQGWIKYGTDNMLPQKIIEINNESAVNKAIIDNKITYIMGVGVDSTVRSSPNAEQSWDQFIERITKDYVTFGGFCFQVILSNNGTKRILYHTDFSKVRVGSVDDYGVAQNYFISNDWRKTSGKTAPVNIKAYSVEKLEIGTPYLFYYKDYEPSLDYYPIPSYFSALNYIEADGLLGKFYRNSINNGFAPSVIVTIPSNPSDEAKSAFNEDMTATFTGANGANKIVVLYGESQEIKPIVTPFVGSKNADLYNNVNDIIFQKIISAHRLSSPTLAGISGSGNLSGNANEIINSYVLYNSTVIHKLRKTILDTVNLFIALNNEPLITIEDIDLSTKINNNDTSNIAERGAL